MSNEAAVKQILDVVLNLGGRAEGFERDTPLLGHVAELDSMAVVVLITTIEEQFGIVVDDDEISAETFETLGSLIDFVDAKVED
jgi:acyl carrier protein